jgi:hypothetical protein
VAEELGFDERGREGGTVDRDEGAVATPAPTMERVGEQSLAGAGLTEEQDGRVRRRDLLDPSEDLAEPRARPDDLVEPARLANLLAEVGCFPPRGDR